MTLINKAQAIFELQKFKNVSEDKFHQVDQEYQLALQQCNDADEIRKVIGMDEELDFPLYLRVETYEKLMKLDKRVRICESSHGI